MRSHIAGQFPRCFSCICVLGLLFIAPSIAAQIPGHVDVPTEIAQLTLNEDDNRECVQENGGNQANQYSRDGLSFSYPAGWAVVDESDAQTQTLKVDPGQDGAKIIIVALRRQMDAVELAEVQPKFTQAIVDTLAQTLARLGAKIQRDSVSSSIGGVQAQGIRLNATLGGESGNADAYWLALGGRLIHLVYLGSDRERATATNAWNMICSTLRVGTPPLTPTTQSTTPRDLNSYSCRRIVDKRVRLYMDKWGRGFAHDLNNDATAVAVLRLMPREFEEEIKWTTQADFLRGKNGRQFSFICPPNGTASGRLWGSGFYTDDSSICTAGVHAGVITLRDGGIVTIEIRPGIEVYASTTRNGITSLSYDFWPGSFVVIREGYNRRGQGSVAGLLDLTKAGDFGHANTRGS